jgi:hypothetical protein
MTEKLTTSKPSRAPVIGAVAFAIVFALLVLNGGWCERYEQRINRIELRKKALETQRR